MEVCIVGFFDLLRDGFAEPEITARLNSELGAKTPWYRLMKQQIYRGLEMSHAQFHGCASRKLGHRVTVKKKGLLMVMTYPWVITEQASVITLSQTSV